MRVWEGAQDLFTWELLFSWGPRPRARVHHAPALSPVTQTLPGLQGEQKREGRVREGKEERRGQATALSLWRGLPSAVGKSEVTSLPALILWADQAWQGGKAWAWGVPVLSECVCVHMRVSVSHADHRPQPTC